MRKMNKRARFKGKVMEVCGEDDEFYCVWLMGKMLEGGTM